MEMLSQELQFRVHLQEVHFQVLHFLFTRVVETLVEVSKLTSIAQLMFYFFITSLTLKDGVPEFQQENPAKHYIFGWNTTYACQKTSQCNSLDCSDCTASSNCSWCLNTNICMYYQEAVQVCSSFVSNPQFCPRNYFYLCNHLAACDYNDCNSCTESGQGCGWCLDSEGCAFRKTSDCRDLIGDSQYCGV